MTYHEGDETIKSAVFLEYEAVKKEQRARIGFRDNLLYATIACYTALFGFASMDKALSLLFVPFVGVVLGWTYLVNDEKISRIGRYVRLVLAARILRTHSNASPQDAEEESAKKVFSWELYHRNDFWRTPRKIGQCVVDLVTFVVPGLVSLAIVWLELPPRSLWVNLGMLIELALLLALGTTIVWLADFRRSESLAELTK